MRRLDQAPGTPGYDDCMLLSRRGRLPSRFLAAFFLAGVAATPALTAEVPETVDPAEIPRYQALRPNLAVGGQPSPQAMRRLGEMGFKTIINLRTRPEGAPEEGEVVRDLGLDYVWVPAKSNTLSLGDIEAVEEVLSDPERGPVLLHCGSSDRVGAVWAVIQVRAGRTMEEAEAAGRAAGLRSPANWEAVLRVLDTTPTPARVNP